METPLDFIQSRDTATKIHYPVLYREILGEIEKLGKDREEFKILDGTLGQGGHSKMILSSLPNAKLCSIDRDSILLENTKQRLGDHPNWTTMVSNFSQIDWNLIPEYKNNLDVILLDLGISLFHYQYSDRGFSFQKNEPLDMRLDPFVKKRASDITNHYSEKELIRVLKDWGEESWAPKIAQKIVLTRKKNPIQTTKDLDDIVKSTIPRKFWPKHIHPSTKTFQALRIEVNSELDHIQIGLQDLLTHLKPGGIFLVISFHSLEDRIVKQVFKSWRDNQFVDWLTKKPIIPQDNEVKENPPSRSAKLRVIQKKYES